jgi:hypothetical protein
MFNQLHLEIAAPALVAAPAFAPARADRTRWIAGPRTILAAVILIALFALTAGGPLFVVSGGAPTVDLAGAAATFR